MEVQLSQSLCEALAEAAEIFGFELLVAFGSQVTGSLHSQSDLDLAVLLKNPEISASEFAELQNSLQVLFQGTEVDLAILNHADPLFLKHIVEHCRILYGDPRTLQRLRILAFKRYQDHRHFLAMEKAYVHRFIRRVNSDHDRR